MMQLSKGQIFSYVFAPQIVPRMRELFSSGFGFVAYFMALVYSAVRLLPDNHPYLNAQNIGRFGVRHVVAEAASHLKFDTRHIDQIALFILILFGLVITIFQFVLLIFSLISNPAMAQSFNDFFVAPNPAQDLANMMMDMVFGVPGIFNSCVQGATMCVDISGRNLTHIAELTAEIGWPYSIHYALHQMLALYSTGMMIVGAMITAYFVVTVVAETAQTGTPFGKRFNKVWAPLRVVFAFGLLMPLGFGLSSGQYIVLYSAKFGSAFASNGWEVFNQVLNDSYLGGMESLVSEPNVPEVASLLQFMFTAKTCKFSDQHFQTEGAVNMYLVKTNAAASTSLQVSNSTSYFSLLNFANGDKQVTVRFGIKDESKYAQQKGAVLPVCGELKFKLSDPRALNPEPGTAAMQSYYWAVLKEMWLTTVAFEGYPEELVKKKNKISPDPNANYPPPDDFIKNTYQFYSEDLRAALINPSITGISSLTGISIGALDLQRASTTWNVSGALTEKGWAAAGIWYNKIAEVNGALTTAVFNIPAATLYPMVLEEVYEKKKTYNQQIDMQTRFRPEVLANGQPLNLATRNEAEHQASMLWEGYELWKEASSSSHAASTGNSIVDTINAIFGTEGLYNMRRNADVHPLAQLVGVGRSLVESAINNIGYAVIGGGANALVNMFSKSLGGLGKAALSFIVTVSMVCLTIGFLLYYVVPFLPFIYFFFAVGGWVKGIFEAMVGVPLWALAHIRIDGNGLPGQAAVNGYFLIFEIFVRPILTVFGMLASVSIFAAMVYVLNDIWDLVTNNVTGYDIRAELETSDPFSGATFSSSLDYFRAAIDEFFFTVIYAIVVYMIGMSSFKLIDAIPNNIMRWMGNAVSTFNDSRENPAESMMNTSYLGTDQVLGKLEGGLQKGVNMTTQT